MQTLVFSRLPDLAGPDHHIALCRFDSCKKTFSHTHDFPEFFLVTRGSGTHVWNGVNLPLERGWLVFVRFVDGHFFRTGKDETLEFINLAVSPTWWYHFERLFNPAISFKGDGASIPPGHRKISESSTIRIEQVLRDLLGRTDCDPAALTRNVVDIVHELQQPAGGSADLSSPDTREVPEWLLRFARDLDNPNLLTRPITFWQKRSGRSPEHLARTCKRCFGCSPTELLNRARVRHVKSRLRTGDEKIAYLALEAGFANLGYFYRVFRRLEGCAPGVWLKRETRSGAVPQ